MFKPTAALKYVLDDKESDAGIQLIHLGTFSLIMIELKALKIIALFLTKTRKSQKGKELLKYHSF